MQLEVTAFVTCTKGFPYVPRGFLSSGQVDETECCYNEKLWCSRGLPDCDRYDRAAYPLGDQWVFEDQMTAFLALSPFPNAIMWNWATIVILGFGIVAALDFQARCMATKTARAAKLGCLIGAAIVLFVALPFSFLGSITRRVRVFGRLVLLPNKSVQRDIRNRPSDFHDVVPIRIYYGHDAPTSEFEVDSCSVALGLPTCGEWTPDRIAFLKLLTQQVSPFLGGWCLIGIMAATMSTSDGAILALGTVVSNNFLRHLDPWFPKLVTPNNLLLMARVSTLPMTFIATFIVAYYR
jgi:hypothetical protein